MVKGISESATYFYENHKDDVESLKYVQDILINALASDKPDSLSKTFQARKELAEEHSMYEYNIERSSGHLESNLDAYQELAAKLAVADGVELNFLS